MPNILPHYPEAGALEMNYKSVGYRQNSQIHLLAFCLPNKKDKREKKDEQKVYFGFSKIHYPSTELVFQ